MDLKEYFRETRHDPILFENARNTAWQWQYKKLRFMPQVTIAAVGGWCFGGAFQPLISCDIAIAADEARFGLSEVNWGIIPAGLVTRDVALAMGYRQALYYIITGESFDGIRAKELGLVNESVPRAELMARVRELTERLRGLNPHVLRTAKEAYRHSMDMNYEQAWDYLGAKASQLRARDTEGAAGSGCPSSWTTRPSSRVSVPMRDPERAPETAMRDLSALLHPRSVAVIGASSNLDSLAGRPIKHLLAGGANITIHPVNPKRDEVGGLRCYPDISAVPEAPDVVLILTPASTVPAALAAAGERGAKAAIVISAGFAEAGTAGGLAQQELTRIARKHDMVLIGPNTIGVHDYRRGLPLSFVWTGRRPTASTGSVAVVTQSGSGMASLCDHILDLDLPLGHGIATGNESDLTVTDLIEYLAEQDEVRVVATVFEEIRDGQRFLAVCRRLRELGKPLVALKLGRTESGSAVAQSHTGALAGSYPTLRALMRQHGVLEVEDLDEIGPTIAAALPGKFPAGRRFAVITSSGGAAVVCADRADELGLELPPFSESAQHRIGTYLPSFSSGHVHNPLDLTAQSTGHGFRMTDILSIALAEPDLDAVIVGTPSGAGEYGLALADRLIGIAAVADKPVISFLMGGEEGAEQRRRQRDGGIPVFRSPGKAVEALERLTRFGRSRAGQAHAPVPEADVVDGDLTTEFEVMSWLAERGIPTVQQALATTATAAMAAAREMGFPVVVKVSSPDIAHKTEVGGVALDLRDADAVSAAFVEVTGSARRAAPNAVIDGVTVSPLIDASAELIVGIHRDPTFGLVLVVGLGGIWTEVFHDVALRALPVDEQDVVEMVDELHGRALLRGARGRSPVDQDALNRLALALAQAALDVGPELRAIELNPVAITAQGRPLVLDAALHLG